ncbi:unnamed protein product [Prorocentrum cordatum]|uniref:Pentatricopeptide repeat-containing protein, chloroplastic n=1 Tax=Prorocentrum cordatum TaxID=2364126 RepID=A0ABN9PWB7_9DINO|nr:unnamed protein product [Polarella glacialis]
MGEQWQRALALLTEMSEAKLDPNAFSYSAGISACDKGQQWQLALTLLSEMWGAKLGSDVVSRNAGISACGKCGQWQRALALLSEMLEAKLAPDSATAPGSARATLAGSGSGRWRCSPTCGRPSWSPAPSQLQLWARRV